MTQRVNHRRGSKRRQDHGPGWESRTPSAGSNSTHVARARTKAKRRASRAERRTGEFDRFSAELVKRERPPVDES